MAVMEFAIALLGSAWMLVVPGLPLALLLAGRDWSWWEVAAVCPVLSLGAGYLVLDVVGRLGLRPDLRFYGAVLTVVTVVTSVAVSRRWPSSRPGWSPQVLLLLFPVAAAALVWWAAFRGFAFLAANQDAINHNFWIARVVDRSSVLTSELRVSSPLQGDVGGQSFYPFAWHASAGTASALFGVASPLLSIVSTAVYWVLGLSVGLLALAGRVTRHGFLTGMIAACLAQVVPLVPGVPMAWGAMTSVIGVALLPAALLGIVEFLERPGLRTSALVAGLIGSLFFTHSPEGATAVVLLGALTLLRAASGRLTRAATLALGGLAAVAVGSALLFLPTLRELASTLTTLLGGNERTLRDSVVTFVSLSINVPTGQALFGVLVLVGAVLAVRISRGPWLLGSVVALAMVYLVAGANGEPFVRLRPLTAPWYGSYERTAWVAVPFLVLLAALPITGLVLLARRWQRFGVLPLVLAASVMAAQAWQGGSAALLQLRRGVVENQVAGPGAERVFRQAEQLQGGNGIILSQTGDGSDYAYMYEDVRVTGGAFDRDGASPELALLLSGLRDLCTLPQAAQLLRREGVSGFLLGTRRIASESPLWTDAELRELPGTTVVAASRDLFLLRPALERCP